MSIAKIPSCLVTLLLSLSCITETGLGADVTPEPYVTYVARPGQYTRCGPGESFYQADPLQPGEEVEVYVETKDGWLGIRPPETSFCWLQADHVRVADDESAGTIVDSNAVAWIGTHLGKARQYRWQVQLAIGEEVTIIGTARREGAEGNEVWYRIVPPPGEFRWVHQSQVVNRIDLVEYRQPQKGSTAEKLADSSRRPLEQTSSVSLDRKSAAPKQLDSALPIGSGLKPQKPDTQEGNNRIAATEMSQSEIPSNASAPTPPSEADRASALPNLRDWLLSGPFSNSQNQAASATNVGSTLPESPGGFEPSGGASREESAVRTAGFQAQASGIDRLPASLEGADIETVKLELSRAMATGASAEEVDPLKKRCAWLAVNSTSQVDRGRAALMMQRVEEYQQIATRRDGVPLGSQPTGGVLPERELIGQIAGTGKEAKFDRQGQLVRVYSSRPDAPPYAITDSVGRTICYVTPVPGVNLRRYLNQEVGLYGRLAFDTTLETPHLITEQAVRLRR